MKMRFYKKGNEGEAIYLGDIVIKGTIDQNRKGLLTTIDLNLREFLSQKLGESVQNTGVKILRSCGDFWSSYQIRKGVAEHSIHNNGFYSTESFTIGKSKVAEADEIVWPESPVVLRESGETDVYVGVDIFDEGFVLKSTATLTNICGGHEDAYFTKITSKNFKQGKRSSAKVFKDEKALRKYLREKEDIFSYICSRNGHMFSWEPASEMYVEERSKPLSGEVFDEIQAILDRINSSDEEEPSYTFGSTAEEEARIRMEELDLFGPVKRDFSKGKLYMSEFGGIIYDLNEEAQEAVRRTAEYGLPYHVIRTNSEEIGDMYAVLFVSNEKIQWDQERLNRDGIMIANVYNASMGIDEIGSIGVTKANGGLQRTA